jgi:hypothetical protein
MSVPAAGRRSDRDSQSVGCSVDYRARYVDDTYAMLPVHRTATERGTATRLPSTARNPLEASVHQSWEGLSPVSTAAKTMDDNLYSVMGNDKSYNLVEIGDIPRLSVPGAQPTSINGGTR